MLKLRKLPVNSLPEDATEGLLLLPHMHLLFRKIDMQRKEPVSYGHRPAEMAVK